MNKIAVSGMKRFNQLKSLSRSISGSDRGKTVSSMSSFLSSSESALLGSFADLKRTAGKLVKEHACLETLEMAAPRWKYKEYGIARSRNTESDIQKDQLVASEDAENSITSISDETPVPSDPHEAPTWKYKEYGIVRSRNTEPDIRKDQLAASEDAENSITSVSDETPVPSDPHEELIVEKPLGKKLALLISGSTGYENYRHQADVCHQYHILKKGGLKDENIVVMMFDDIAYDPENPRPGTLINDPSAVDVYKGVPKDYSGNAVNVENFLNVLLGDKIALAGQGTGKVIDSGPHDTIFIYSSGHGDRGLLYLPDGFITFEDVLQPGMNILAITSSNAVQDSSSYHCPEDKKAGPPSEYGICVGNLFSSCWMQECEEKDMNLTTINMLFKRVQLNTFLHGATLGQQHVMRYGDVEKLGDQLMSTYIGSAHLRNGEFNSSDEDGCRKLQKELGHQESKEERQRALLQMQGKALDGNPIDNKEMTSKEVQNGGSQTRPSNTCDLFSEGSLKPDVGD